MYSRQKRDQQRAQRRSSSIKKPRNDENVPNQVVEMQNPEWDEFDYADKNTGADQSDNPSTFSSALQNVDKQEYLFQGSSHTTSDFFMAVLTATRKGNFTDGQTKLVLRLFKEFLPQPNKVTVDMRTFRSKIGIFVPDTDKYRFCKKCGNEDRDCRCKEPIPRIGHFIHFDFITQLQELCDRNADLINEYLLELKSVPAGSVKDCLNGKAFDLNEKIVHLALYTDGAKISNSSNRQLWVFGVTVLNLPMKVRFAEGNFIYVFAYYGEGKPQWKNLETEFLNQLGTEIFVKDELFTIKISQILGDIPAKASLCGLKINGQFPCMRCCVQGEWINGTNRYDCFEYDPRTADECREKSRVAQETGKPLEVFKSVSVLQDYVEFPDCYMTDVMHSFYEGPIQLDLKMILENKKIFHKFNSVILSLNSALPSDLSGRSLRFIDDLINFKAREWKVLLLYIVVIVFNQISDCEFIVGKNTTVLKRQMLNILHLIAAIIGLSLDCVTKESIKHSEKLMRKWFADREDLFKTVAEKKNPYNPKVHDLTHLIKQTENHGPTQSTSCFGGENIMGRSDDLITAKDPTVVLKQIYRRSRECALVKRWIHRKKTDPILADFIKSIHKSNDYEGKAAMQIPPSALIAKEKNKKFGLTTAKINRYQFKPSPLPEKLNNNAVCFYEKSTGELQPARIEYIVQSGTALYCQIREYKTIPIWNDFFQKDELLSNNLSFPDYGIVKEQSGDPLIIPAEKIKRKGFLLLSAKQYIIPLLHAFEHD